MIKWRGRHDDNGINFGKPKAEITLAMGSGFSTNLNFISLKI